MREAILLETQRKLTVSSLRLEERSRLAVRITLLRFSESKDGALMGPKEDWRLAYFALRPLPSSVSGGRTTRRPSMGVVYLSKASRPREPARSQLMMAPTMTPRRAQRTPSATNPKQTLRGHQKENSQSQ